MRQWLKEHRRIILLKIAVGCALTVAHYYPEHMPGLLVNLVWLVLF